MKIQQITFTDHPVFPASSTITFFDQTETNIPKIFFLVGNNGAGKTHILESLYYGFVGKLNSYNIPSCKFKMDILLSEPEKSIIPKNLIPKTSSDFLSFHLVKRTHNSSDNHGYTNFVKSVYSRVHINFNVPSIGSVTAKNIDDIENPKDESYELEKQIPQLLIDIKAQDDAEISDQARKNSGNVDLEIYGIKFKRFQDAFEKMYAGSKIFKEIINESNQKKIIFSDENGEDVELNSLSTGEKQIIFRVGDLLKNLNNLDGAIIFIDEPETSLHPIRQQKYVQFLLDIFDGLDVQFIVATHSPYVLQGLREGESICLKVDKNSSTTEKAEKIGYYPSSLKNPSINLINYLAYGIYDELLHIELFTALQIKNNITKITSMSSLFVNLPDKTFQTTVPSQLYPSIGTSVTEKLPVFIRNAIHHPDESGRSYNKYELEQSIKTMLSLL